MKNKWQVKDQSVHCGNNEVQAFDSIYSQGKNQIPLIQGQEQRVALEKYWRNLHPSCFWDSNQCTVLYL